MNRSAVAIAVVIVSGLAGVGAGAYSGRDRTGERLPDWVRIAGKAYADRTADEIRPDVAARADALLVRKVILIVAPPDSKRRMWTVSRKALGERADVEGTIRAAFSAARSESLWGRLTRRVIHRDPIDIPMQRTVDGEAVRKYLVRNVQGVVTKPARSARMTLRAGKPQIIPEEPGSTLDLESSVSAIVELLRAGDGERVNLPLKPLEPDVTADDAQGIEAEIARFETHYRERGNRRLNLELACSRINGSIIKPGGVFSYNDTVGPRVAEAGFKMAPVIVQGRMEPGMGGGICQVSSTLYNAALLAGLGVVRRQHHAFPVHYLPAGRDATVVYGAIDLKLKNTSDRAVGIVADGSNGKVVIRVFGTPSPGRTISIERSGISSWAAPVKTIQDPTLPAGKTIVRDKGHAGHRVSVWRVVRENGRLVRRELISRDVYAAFPRIVVQGTGPAAPAPPAQRPSPAPGTSAVVRPLPPAGLTP
ncbi:MAG: hypothetical protein GX446_05255 [Chthonomonadales bacterium]|nr:hypothetical protein [Chthonomonadales bacterium]